MMKPTKWLCAQRRLRSAWASAQSDQLRPAWESAQFDQSSLCTQWVDRKPSFRHADSEDPDQTGHFVGFVTRRLILPTMRPLDC